MAESLFYDCGTDWENYSGNICDKATSGMGDVIFLKPGVVDLDLGTVTDDVLVLDIAKVQALLDTNRARIVNGVRMGIEAPSEVTSDSFMACAADVVVTYDRSITLKDRKVNQVGITFYNSINSAAGFVIGGMLIHECAANRITYVDRRLSLSGGRISPEGKELQRFEFTLKYEGVGDDRILPYADVFDLVPATVSSGV